jgi:hypothetical protein
MNKINILMTGRIMTSMKHENNKQDTRNWEYEDEATRKLRKPYSEELQNFYFLPKNDYVNQTKDYLTGNLSSKHAEDEISRHTYC